MLSSPASLFQVGTLALLAEYTKGANPRASGILLSVSPILSQKCWDYRHIMESAFYMHLQDLNSGPRSCSRDALPTETYP